MIIYTETASKEFQPLEDNRGTSVTFQLSSRYHEEEGSTKVMYVHELYSIVREQRSKSDILFENEFEYSAWFEKLEIPNLDLAYHLMHEYDLHNIVERTMAGERTMLILPNEKINIKYSEDINEYNRIILSKRLAFIVNFVAHVIFCECKGTLQELGYTMITDGVIVHNSFFDEDGLRDAIITTFFDGRKVRVGKWNLRDIVERARIEGTVLFIPLESVYPLNLCVQFNCEKEIRVVSSKNMSLLQRHEGKEKYASFVLYDAIPGSGKTYHMLNKVKQNQNAIIIVPTRVQAEQLKSQGFTVFTIDSLHHRLMSLHKNTFIYNLLISVKHIYIDECYMIHSGQLKWIIQKVREICTFETLTCYGDKGQIPFYSFTQVVIKHSRDFQNEIKERYVMNGTYRCPQKLVPFLSAAYKQKIVSYNEYDGDISSEVDTEEEIIKYLKIMKAYNVITFTQAEKDILIRNGIVAHTIAEVQGQTFTSTAIVRLNKYERQVYYSIPHLVVALSRSTEAILYCTVTSDKLFKIMKQIAYQEEIQIEEEKMKIGIHKYILSPAQFEQEEKMLNAIEQVNSFSYQQKINTFSQEQMDQKGYLTEHIIFKDILNRIDIYIMAMQYYMDRNYHKINPHHMTKEEYIQNVLSMKELLQNRRVKINEVRFSEILSKETLKYDDKQYYKIETSKLKTGEFIIKHVPKARIDEMDMLSLLTSIYKRNADPAQIRDFMLSLEPNVIIDRFFYTFIDNDKFQALSTNINQFVKNYNAEWIRTRNIQQINKLQYELENISDIDFSSYNAFIKTIIKNKFDSTQYDEAQAAQVVAGAQAIMVQYFTPMVKRFSDLLKNVMKKNILINDGINVVYMEWFVNHSLNAGNCEKVMALEMDYSKFDKNQDWLDLYYQVLIMEKFGIDRKTLSQWVAVHMITTLHFRQYGMTMKTFTQRKSGDAFTFMGNTLFTMLMYSTFYYDSKFLCALFGGDDSLILFDSDNEQQFEDKSEVIGAAFNMEIKYMNTDKSIMFASRFFVFDDDHVYILPDLLKQYLRYNRIAKSKEHVVAQQISSYILDQKIFTLSKSVWDKYFNMIVDRYQIDETELSDFEEILIIYLALIYYGKTYKLYYQFNKMRNANKEEMMKIKMRFAKKHTIAEVKQRILQTAWSWEKQFLNQYLSNEYIDIIVKNEYRKRVDIVLDYVNFDIYQLVHPIIDRVRMYCDKNGIKYHKIPIIDMKDKNNEYIKSKNIQMEEKSCFVQFIDTIKSFMFGKKHKMDMVIEISSRVREVIDFDYYLNILYMTLRHVDIQLGLQVNIQFAQ